jgi:hypothetical protein
MYALGVVLSVLGVWRALLGFWSGRLLLREGQLYGYSVLRGAAFQGAGLVLLGMQIAVTGTETVGVAGSGLGWIGVLLVLIGTVVEFRGRRHSKGS